MKRVTLLAGHYGSGKTNIAVNMAINAATENAGKRLAIADLDIVNPYFRTEDSREELEAAGIRLICSGYANTNVDLPSMPDDLYAITDDHDLQVIIDVGGDDRGALALGRLSGALKEENDYDMYMVINCYRPLSRDPESTVEIMREIEWAGRMPFTGLINNSNLGRDTTAEDVLNSIPYAEKISELTGLPVFATSVENSLFEELKEKIPNLMPLKLQKRPV
ncbi:MAG: AAA family ATPase [Lachnospiraceae bacterium]|nr:AAA family ATPase [Lachnospiraceae bacterium]